MSEWKTIDELHEGDLVAEISVRPGHSGGPIFSFLICKRFERNGMPCRSAHLNPKHLDSAAVLLERVKERIREEGAKAMGAVS